MTSKVVIVPKVGGEGYRRTLKRAEVLEEAANRMPGLAPFTAEFSGDVTDIFFDTERDERRRIEAQTGLHQGDVMGPDPHIMPLGT